MARRISQSDYINADNSSSESSAIAAAAAAVIAAGGSLMDDSSLSPHKFKAHPCDQCNQSFARAHDLKRHKLGLHDQVKPYPCPHCGRSFSRQDALSRHLKISETGRAACSALREGKMYDADSPNRRIRTIRNYHDMSSKYSNHMEHSLFFDSGHDAILPLEASPILDKSQLLEQNKTLSQRIISLEGQLLQQSLHSKELENQIKQLQVEKEILRNLLSSKSSDGSSPPFGHSESVNGSFLQKV